VYAQFVGLGAERNDSARQTENSLSSETIRLKQEIPGYSSNVRAKPPRFAAWPLFVLLQR
jgi:hypothetical protein